MAYLPKDNQDQENTLGMNQPSTNAAQQQPSDAASASGTNISGGAAPTAPSFPQPGMNQQAKQPASSGLFTNIQSYIKANSPTNLGQAIGTKLTNQAKGAQGQLKQAQGNFQRQLEGGSLANRGQAVQDVSRITGAARNVNAMPTPAAPAQQAAPQQPTQPQAPQAPVQLPPGVEVNQQITTAAPQNQSTMSKFANMMQGQGLAGPVGEPVSSTPSTGNVAASSLFSGSKPSNAQSTAAPTQTEAPAAPQVITPDYLSQLGQGDAQRFKEIINARYQGPGSLRDSGVYNKLYNRATDVQANMESAKSSQGREDLLGRLYGTAQTPYTRGMSKLDNLLISSDKGAQNQIQQAIQGSGNLKQDLQRAQLESLSRGQSRAAEIADIQKQARGEFTTQQDAERKVTEDRITNALGQSEEYYKAMNQFLQTDPNAPVDITPEIASMLGIQGNEGFYKIKDLPKQVLERAAMISKNEQARQVALSQLARLDQQKKLDTQLQYADAAKAGTQKATDIVNTAQLQRDLVDAENKFRQFAQGADITGTGTGKAKYKKGMFRGRGTVNAYAEATQNLGELLKAQGYDLSPVQVGQILESDPAIRQAMGLEDADMFNIDDTGMTNSQGLMGAAQAAGIGALAPAAIGAGVSAAYGGGLAGLGAGASAGLGAAGMGAGVGAGLAYLTDADFREALPGLGQQVGELGGKISGLGLVDKDNTIGKLQGQVLGEALKASNEIVGSSGEMLDTFASPLGDFGKLVTLGGSDLLGGGKGSAQRKAQSQANQAASADLRKNLLSALAEQGFDRRAKTLDQGSEQSKLEQINQQRAEAAAKTQQVQNELDNLRRTGGKAIMAQDAGQNERVAEYNNRLAALKQQLKDSRAAQGQFDPKVLAQQAILDRATKATERTAGIKELLARIDRTNF